MDRRCGREQVHSGGRREPARGQGGEIRPELEFGCATSASLPSMLDQTKLSRLCLRTAPVTSPTQAIAAACLELRFCGLKGRRASIAAHAERLSQDAIQRPRPPQGLSAIAKLMDPTHRPFAAENSVIDTDFVDRRDEVCLMIAQRHRFALTLCCAFGGSPRPA
jgi:hypothetical protein